MKQAQLKAPEEINYAGVAELAVYSRAPPAEDAAKAVKAQRSATGKAVTPPPTEPGTC